MGGCCLGTTVLLLKLYPQALGSERQALDRVEKAHLGEGT